GCYVPLVTYNPLDAKLGIVGIPAAAAGTTGGLSTHDSLAAVGTNVSAIKTKTDVALPSTAYGTEGGLATHVIVAGTAEYVVATATNVDLLKDLLEADIVVDTSVTPWARVLIKKDTGGLGVGIELLRQPMYDTTGAGVTS